MLPSFRLLYAINYSVCLNVLVSYFRQLFCGNRAIVQTTSDTKMRFCTEVSFVSLISQGIDLKFGM